LLGDINDSNEEEAADDRQMLKRCRELSSGVGAGKQPEAMRH
jgi:hypothetical protein